MSSKFREHLSVITTQSPLETSRFSSSPTIALSSPFSFASFGRTISRQPKSTHPPKDIEADASPPASSLRDRFTKLFSNLPSFGNTNETPDVPLRLSQWPPLHIEKRRCQCHFNDPKDEARVRKHRRRSQCFLVFLIVVLLLLVGDAIFLNIRVLSLSASQPTSQTISIFHSLSVDAQQCLSQFTLNAPSSPRSYPCSTCLPVLQAVPSSYTSSSANSQNSKSINRATQFCGLRAVFETANAQGQSALGNGSWAQNVNFCTWNGVSCDTSGHVTSLQLTYPGVPATLPSEIGGLTTLQIFQVIGGNSIPAGSLPSSFANLTSLAMLHLESTSITALPNTLFASPGLTRLSSLALLHNPQMGSTLPSSLTSLAGLQTLLVNSQTLSPASLVTLASSSSLTASLHTLDLTSTSLTGFVPSLSTFKGLTQLLLGSNNLTGTVPTFPKTLQVLELNGNAGLGGSIACSSGSLRQCSIQGTTISVAGCSICQNGTISA